MSNFKLQQEGLSSSTSIPNNFIENFMPTAAGEFVKIYIYLLKCVSENTSELSISRIADVFNDTEKDVTRALKYWEKKGLLKLAFDEDGALTSLVLKDADQLQPTNITRESVPDDETAAGLPAASVIPFAASEDAAATPEPKQYSRAELETFSKSEDNSMLIFVIQKLIGRTMTSADINTIMFFEDTLNFPQDLIEYLFEYCAEKKKTSRRYIEKTGIAWAEQGISDVQGAKLINAVYSENCYPVMKAFGLTGRNPAKEECRYIDRWVLSYGFSLDMILEAVNRTINTIHQPSFEYADSILKRWKADNIATIDDVKRSDSEFNQRNSSKSAASSANISRKKAASTSFNSFDQRTYDYDALEAKLVNKK